MSMESPARRARDESETDELGVCVRGETERPASNTNVPLAAPARPPAAGVSRLLSQTIGILRKDLLLEWRSRTRLNATVFFSLVTLLLFSFAGGPDAAALAHNAAGYLWLAILLASVLSLGESFRLEHENAALEGLRLVPVDPGAIFLGKALASFLFLVALSFLLVPVMVALFGIELRAGLARTALVLLLGCGAISAPGTLYAAIANQARARDVLLPLLLFPVLVPALVGAVRATGLVLTGDPMNQLPTWIGLLLVFNLTYWALCFVLFGRVIEE